MVLSQYDSTMGDLLIRNVPKRTIDSLKARARRHGRSLQAEVLSLLQQVDIPDGDRMIEWLNSVRQPGLSARPGIDAIRKAREER